MTTHTFGRPNPLVKTFTNLHIQKTRCRSLVREGGFEPLRVIDPLHSRCSPSANSSTRALRGRWDSNPRACLHRPSVFKTAPLNHSGTPPVLHDGQRRANVSGRCFHFCSSRPFVSATYSPSRFSWPFRTIWPMIEEMSFRESADSVLTVFDSMASTIRSTTSPTGAR